MIDHRRGQKRTDSTLPDALDYRSAFAAGWELANWASSNQCPNSNMMLAEFSSRLKIDWPPKDMTSGEYTREVRQALRGGIPYLSNWLDIGILSNTLALETRSLKQRSKQQQRGRNLAAKPLRAAQTRFARLLAKTGATATERQLITSAVQGLLNNREDEAVPFFIDSLGAFSARMERDLVNDALDHLLGENVKGKIDVAIVTVREDEHAAVLKRFPQMRLFHADNRSYSISIVPLEDGGQYVVAVVRSIEQGEGNGQPGCCSRRDRRSRPSLAFLGGNMRSRSRNGVHVR